MTFNYIYIYIKLLIENREKKGSFSQTGLKIKIKLKKDKGRITSQGQCRVRSAETHIRRECEWLSTISNGQSMPGLLNEEMHNKLFLLRSEFVLLYK